MKHRVALAAILGMALPLLAVQPLHADRFSNDLQRLVWLQSDFGLPVKGYVIEGWFCLPCRPGMQVKLERELCLTSGEQQSTLADGSRLNTVLQFRDGYYNVEVQLITEHLDTAQSYYALWQGFADCNQPKQPVGVTMIYEWDEILSLAAQEQLAAELLRGLDVTRDGVILDLLGQTSGYSPQLRHCLTIAGKAVNYNLAFRTINKRTVLYLASPVIYQQY